MPNKDLLDNIKKLRELTGVGFKDCKLALDESNGDIEKSVEFLRKKGIAKASKKMSRTASEGLALVKEKEGEVSIIEIINRGETFFESIFSPSHIFFINFFWSSVSIIVKLLLNPTASACLLNNFTLIE